MPLIVNNHVVPTTVYHISNPNKQAPIFYMIPGNPGLCEFYETFLEELKTLCPSFEYLCPSHIGFDTLTQSNYQLHPGNPVHTLDEQVDHKVSLLREFVRGEANGNNKNGKPRDVVIMGHSVGAWMVQRIAVAFENDPAVHIKLVGLLTPTIMDICKSERGKIFSKVGGYISPGYCLSRLSQLLSWTVSPSYIKSGLNYIMGKPSEVALNAAASLVTKPKIVEQALTMAAEEMKRIGSQFEADDIKGFWDADSGYNIWLYFVKMDHWVAEETRELILQKTKDLSNVKSTVEKEDSAIVHAFCVRDSLHVAKLVQEQINGVKISLGEGDHAGNVGTVSSSTKVSETKNKFGNKETTGSIEMALVDLEADRTKHKN